MKYVLQANITKAETSVKNSFFSVGNDVFLLVYPSMITYAIKV
jgi:hypothetical protein